MTGWCDESEVKLLLPPKSGFFSSISTPFNRIMPKAFANTILKIKNKKTKVLQKSFLTFVNIKIKIYLKQYNFLKVSRSFIGFSRLELHLKR